ncbi:rhodanese-like domain-containing protein [Halothiobacillus sp. DCM-1]|uniref:rhodanese-like domain-containing protein n=1 Tax=Halothiobacillus sp. DCM-1 TaxID=3112558 RepID=UPI0032515017
MQELMDFLMRHWMLTLAALVLTVMLIGNELTRGMKKFRDLGAAEFARAIGQENALLIDVRETDEFRGEHIKGARHIALGSLAGKLGELESHKASPVLVYCRSGNRSSAGANILVKAGFTNVAHLAGGIMAWKGESYPVTKK